MGIVHHGPKFMILPTMNGLGTTFENRSRSSQACDFAKSFER
jgi:hypothetical protein